MTAPDLRTAVRAAIRDVERRVDTCPGCDTSKAHGVHGKDCSWKALRSALTAEATEPPGEVRVNACQTNATTPEAQAALDAIVDAVVQQYSAGPAPDPQEKTMQKTMHPTDLVRRLRDAADLSKTDNDSAPAPDVLLAEAADEIERLRRNQWRAHG